jgi:hypothetical protein
MSRREGGISMRDSSIGSCGAALFLSAAFVLIFGAVPSYAGPKVTICHFPPGNPGNAQAIVVGEPALDAHLGHGDELGDCANQPACGDEVVEGTEECDAGSENGDNQPCTTSCKVAICGDGLLCNDSSCTSGSFDGVPSPEECDGEVADPVNFACLPAGHENACHIVAINPI